MNRQSLARLTFFVAAVLGAAEPNVVDAQAAAPAVVVPLEAAPKAAAPVVPATTGPCCGTITPDGFRLAALIDSMHVDQLWQAHVHVNWETGEPDRPAGYTGGDRATHCSTFAAAAGERLNVYLLRPPEHVQSYLATAQGKWLRGSEGAAKGWKQLEGAGHEQRAQELANQGNFVVIVCESPDPQKPGHIAIVRPSDKTAEALGKEGPQIAQAGRENHVSAPGSIAFINHPGAWPDQVTYFWHSVDWSAVTPKTAKEQ